MKNGGTDLAMRKTAVFFTDEKKDDIFFEFGTKKTQESGQIPGSKSTSV